MIDGARWKAVLESARQTWRVGTIRDDADDLRIELAAHDRVMNGREIRAAAGEEDG